MYETTMQFLDQILTFFHTILAFEVIAGISLRTVFLYNMLLIAFFYVFAKRSS